MSANLLIGNWKLASWQVVTGNEANTSSRSAEGLMILTREGRAMTVTTAETRTSGESEARRAALHRSMLAYTGKYRIEGNEFVATVDASWNEGWNGSGGGRVQARRRQSFVESAPAPSIVSPGKIDFRRIVGNAKSEKSYRQECSLLELRVRVEPRRVIGDSPQCRLDQLDQTGVRPEASKVSGNI